MFVFIVKEHTFQISIFINFNFIMLPIFLTRAGEINRRRVNLRLLRERIRLRRENDPFDLPDRRFIEIFRLNKSLVRDLINMIQLHFHQRNLPRGITIEMYILNFFPFYCCYRSHT